MEASTTIKRYNMAPPNEQDVLTSLARLVGPDVARQLWTAACGQAGIRNGATLSLQQLDGALQQLKQVKGLASVAANSLLVRVKSFRTLSSMNT
jgi:hypothetical protein